MSIFHSNPPARFCRVSLALLFTLVLPAQQSNQFQGSVPARTVSTTPIQLKLGDAILRGLRTNLGLLERQTASQTARAERIRALSALLPQFTGSYEHAVEQLNLETLGLRPSTFAGVSI